MLAANGLPTESESFESSTTEAEMQCSEALVKRRKRLKQKHQCTSALWVSLVLHTKKE